MRRCRRCGSSRVEFLHDHFYRIEVCADCERTASSRRAAIQVAGYCVVVLIAALVVWASGGAR